ncbi:TonB-dependent receptor [Ignavibacteria bacterium 4148-Me]|uniref:TonB-dependent receptor n=1 Tax=Rosettibacter primus TaxID=3111523 RepID=UPI00336BE6FB
MKTIKVSWIYLVFFYFILLFNNSIVLSAGGKLIGKVIDKNTKEPLIGVSIVIEGINMGAATDVEGEYLVINIPPGVYNVRASMVGYQTITKTNVEISVNHTTYLDFELEEAVIQLSEGIVVVADKPLIQKDLTSTRHFVSSKEIFSRPTNQLTTLLSTLPGIDVSSSGEILVRGGTLDQVAFVIDGIRARNPLDFQPYTNINLSAIQELEIITGGFNAEYGEAQSGVFNIITKEGSEKFQAYAEIRYTPPGLKHWGTSLYDYSTSKFWENTHARHLQWWIDNPNQWVDPNGIPGNDPNCIWKPEQAYEDYIKTHQPLTDYTKLATYQTEFSLGGPLPIDNMYYFFSGKYRTSPPISGNTYERRGRWFDGTLKINYKLSKNIKLLFSGFYSDSKTSHGMEYLAFENGYNNKYALYDFAGYPKNRVDGQTLKLTHILGEYTFYELQLSRIYRYRSQWTFPGDDSGWETGTPTYDRLRALNEYGLPIPGGYNNIIGLHTTGYYYRGIDKNTDYTLSFDFVSQLEKQVQIKTGFDFTYYHIDRYQEGKAYNIVEKAVYKPYEGNIYAQSTLEFEGLIMNVGLRYDFYNPNDYVYKNIFDPLDIINATKDGRTPNPLKEPTKIFGQLSPRIGISHPISENTVLHFSYGHFFQRANFGDYGEGSGSNVEGQTVSGILNSYFIKNADGTLTPYNLGNRLLKPRKTVAYELGIEHNFGGIVSMITAYYKDITNTIRTVTVFMDDGTSYLTTGNSNYADEKGIEISLRKPLTELWGGYLNFSWSTGITGRSGDPDIVASPKSGIQSRITQFTGDYINYEPPRLKFGVIFAVPKDFSFMFNAFSNMQISLDYQIYYPHKQIASDNISEGGKTYTRMPYKNALFRVRKEFPIRPGFSLAAFLEISNLFNDTHTNLQVINSSTATLEDRVKFINSRFTVFPEYTPDGSPFPEPIKYLNLPRSIVLGLAVEIK